MLGRNNWKTYTVLRDHEAPHGLLTGRLDQNQVDHIHVVHLEHALIRGAVILVTRMLLDAPLPRIHRILYLRKLCLYLPEMKKPRLSQH